MTQPKRSFIVGEEWLYYKIYAGPKTCDLILTDLLKPVTENLLKANDIDQWFFIRYNDPKHHLRVRFHYTKKEAIANIINSLYEPLNEYISEDLIWKVQLDTYHREIERYGITTIEESERLFFYNSRMIVDFLNEIDGEEGEQIRWLFAMRAIDNLLYCFGYTEESKLQLLERLKLSFGQEFGIDKNLRKQLDKKFRNSQELIEEFMSFNRESKPEYAILIDLLEAHATRISKLVKVIQDKCVQSVLDDRMGSYIHMLMNRLFRSKNRKHELVVYDLLYKKYKIDWGIRMFKKTTVAKS